LDEVDPVRTFEKLGIALDEQKNYQMSQLMLF
jgi:hypothetical protein